MKESVFMQIRKFNNNDLDEVISLHRETLRRENAYRGDGVWEIDLHNIPAAYFLDNGDFIVGVENGRIVAMGALKRFDDATGEITRMRVHPDYQGRGYGSEVLRNLEETARSLGYKTLILETDEKLKTAIRLYEKNGFTFWKREFLDGYDCLWYRKDI